jgi:hypothetical protein
MSYLPQPQVLIDDVDVSSAVLNGVSISTGRDGIDVQSRAGYARIGLLQLDALPSIPRLGARVKINADPDDGGGLVRLFTGNLTDVDTSMLGYGSRGQSAVAYLTAVGPLSRLVRTKGDPAGYPEQYDGDRIFTVLDTLADTWQTIGVSTWGGFDNDKDWLNADQTPIEVQQPGSYLLDQIDPSEDPPDPQSVVVQAAQDGLGQIEETRQGAIRYTASTGRLVRSSSAFLALPATGVLYQTLASSSSVNELVNQATVSWVNRYIEYETTYPWDPELELHVEVVTETPVKETLSAYAESLTSIQEFGVYARDVSTQLADGDDAQARAQRLIDLYAEPARSLRAVTVQLTDELPASLRRGLLEVSPGQPVRARAIPQVIVEDFSGFVESVVWNLSRTAASVTLGVSDWRLSEDLRIWTDVADTLTWQDTDLEIDWNRAQELTSG